MGEMSIDVAHLLRWAIGMPFYGELSLRTVLPNKLPETDETDDLLCCCPYPYLVVSCANRSLCLHFRHHHVGSQEAPTQQRDHLLGHCHPIPHLHCSNMYVVFLLDVTSGFPR